MEPMYITLIVGGLMLVSYIWAKVPYGMTAVLGCLALEVMGVLTPAEAWGGFGNTTVFLFSSIFILGAGLMKTSFVSSIQKLVRKYGNSEKKLLWFCMAMSSILAMLTSATAAGATMLPMVTILSEESGVRKNRLLKPVIDIGCISFAIMPFGMGAAFFNQGNAYLESAGYSIRLGAFDGMIARLPVVFITMLFIGTIGYRLLPNRESAQSDMPEILPDEKRLSPTIDRLGKFIFFSSIIGMIVSSAVGISSHYAAIIGSAMMILCGVLDGKEAFRSIDLNTVCIFAGSLSFATALTKTGAAGLIAESLSLLTDWTMNQFLLVGIFLLVPFVMTQFMGNIPVINLTMPIAAIVAANTGMNPTAIMIATIAGATLSVATPMAAGVQALIMEPGNYKFTDYLKNGIPTAFVFTAAYILWLPIVFPLY